MLTFLPFGLTAGIIYFALATIIGIKKHIPLFKQFLLLTLFLYLMAVLAITIFPIPLSAGYSVGGNNFILFSTIISELNDIVNSIALKDNILNFAGNILLFVPFGFLIPLTYKKFSHAYIIIPSGFAASLTVELCQLTISRILGFTYRSFDVDDIILNTFGTITGFIILRVFQFLLRHRQNLKSPRSWIVISSFLVVFAFVSYWGYEYYTHFTPAKAQECYASNVCPLESFPFAKGVVLITATDPSVFKQAGYVAWYMKKNPFWGWEISNQSVEILGQKGTSVTADGRTFIWGTHANSGSNISTYKYKGKRYAVKTDPLGFWHIIIPSS